MECFTKQWELFHTIDNHRQCLKRGNLFKQKQQPPQCRGNAEKILSDVIK